jgi:hypothetical protein
MNNLARLAHRTAGRRQRRAQMALCFAGRKYVLHAANTLHGNNASITDILEHATLTQRRFDRDVMRKLL